LPAIYVNIKQIYQKYKKPALRVFGKCVHVFDYLS